MRKGYIFIITLLFVVMIFATGCNRESVKYISPDADVIDGSYENTQTEGNTADKDTQTDVNSELVDDVGHSGNQSDTVPVYVCGAVNNPGVYYLSPDSLKADALHMAGGLTPDAATYYVNLAETVASGEKIYFPYADEVADSVNVSQNDNGQDNSGKININTATKEELMTLPGIGESKACAIIRYREEYGPFQTIEDITNISGIKEGVYNNIRDYIIVN